MAARINEKELRVGIVGLGLIGGSMAKTIKKNTAHTVLGYDIQNSALLKAELVGAIDGRLTDESLPQCDVVIVALYPGETIRCITDKSGLFAAGALVVDCSGVKQGVCEALDNLARDQPWTFIGGHPMAGREHSGFEYATEDLFAKASMILTPAPETDIETRSAAKSFFLSAGFAQVVFCSPQEHDEMIAYTSQMAHVISSAYVKSDLALKHKGFSAGSFQDMTRVARLNEKMWAELFLSNQKPLLHEIDGIMRRLKSYRDVLAAGDESALITLLREGRERKELLGEG